MISLTAATRIYLYRGATDMRRSFNGLSGMVRQHFSADLLSGGTQRQCDSHKVFTLGHLLSNGRPERKRWPLRIEGARSPQSRKMPGRP